MGQEPYGRSNGRATTLGWPPTFQSVLVAARASSVTVLLVAALVGVFVAEHLQSPIPTSSSLVNRYRTATAARLESGADPPDAVNSGEWWRLVTYGFIHSDASELLPISWSSPYSGWCSRSRLDTYVGLWSFLCPLWGAACSAYASSLHFAVTEGASGGILGLAAAGLLRPALPIAGGSVVGCRACAPPRSVRRALRPECVQRGTCRRCGHWSDRRPCPGNSVANPAIRGGGHRRVETG